MAFDLEGALKEVSESDVAQYLSKKNGKNYDELRQKNLTDAQINSSFLAMDPKDYEDTVARNFNEKSMGDIERGIVRGSHGVVSGMGGMAALGGQAIAGMGAEETGQAIQDAGMETYKKHEHSASLNPKDKFSDSPVGWVAGTVGELIPVMGEVAISSAMGAGGGTLIAKQMIKQGMEVAAKKAIKNKAVKMGAKTGLTAGMFPLETGGMYGELRNEHGVKAPWSSAFFGSLATAIEFIPGGNAKMIDTLFDAVSTGKGGVAKAIAKELLETMPSEALQEAGQETLAILNVVANTDEKLLTKENMFRVGESAGAGLVGGGMGAVPKGIVSGMKKAPLVDDDTDQGQKEITGLDQEKLADPEVITDPGEIITQDETIPGLGEEKTNAFGRSGQKEPTEVEPSEVVEEEEQKTGSIHDMPTVTPEEERERSRKKAQALGYSTFNSVDEFEEKPAKPVESEYEVSTDDVETDPTEAQKEAGNYKKSHIKIDGLDISIENPDGSVRKGKNKAGKEWESKMNGHYGYFKRTLGKDGDQVDVVVKPGTETSPKVFVVDQVNEQGQFDEHKVIMGTESAEEAKSLYMSNYEKGWKGFSGITGMDTDTFKGWVKDGKRTKQPVQKTSIKNPSPDTTKAAENIVVSPAIEKKDIATFESDQPVSFETKKGNKTGTIIKKDGNHWLVKKDDNGRKTLVKDPIALSADSVKSVKETPEIVEKPESKETPEMVETSKKDELTRRTEIEDRVSKELIDVAKQSKRRYGEIPLTDLAVDIAQDAIDTRQRMKKEKRFELAEKHGVPEYVVHQLTTGGPGYEMLAGRSQMGEKESAEFLSNKKFFDSQEKLVPKQTKEEMNDSIDSFFGGDGKALPKFKDIPENMSPLVTKIQPGAIQKSATGRKLTPFPKVDVSTPMKAKFTENRVNKWLIENAQAEAKARGDKFNGRTWTLESAHNLSPADKDMAAMYIFEDQPPVQKSITKPLVEKKEIAILGNENRETKKAPKGFDPDSLLAEFDKEARKVTAKEKLADAKGHLSNAADILKKMNAKLGERGSFSTEDTDENLYAELKPMLQEMLNEVLMAGKDAAEFAKMVVQGLSPKGRPFFKRFVENDMVIDESLMEEYDKTKKEADDADNEGRSGLQDLDSGTNEAVPGRRDGDLAGDGLTETTGHDSVVGVQLPEDVQGSDGSGDSGTNGIRPASQELGIDGEIPGSGDEQIGRPDNGGTGLADNGSGGRGRDQLGNYHIEDPEKLIGGTPKVRFKRNRTAIETFNKVMNEARNPTAEERDAIAAYIGWGSFGQDLFKGYWGNPIYKDGWQKENDWLRKHLGESAWKSAQASIINAHYTDPPTVNAIWDIAKRLGFKGGRVLEPSMGIGNFYGLMPKDLKATSDLTGIELDETTAEMAKMLYPDTNVQQMGYEKSKTADGFYDLAIGNWPFAAESPADRRYNKHRLTLHDYFFVKALDQVRDGGFVIGITSSGTMDKMGKVARRQMEKRGTLVAAYRMPMGAFKKYAGTSVVADILVFQKHDGKNKAEHHAPWMESVPMKDARGNEVKAEYGRVIKVNEYWGHVPENVLGDMTVGHGTTQGREGMIVERENGYEGVLNALSERVPADIMTKRNKTNNIQYVSNNTEERQNSIVTTKNGLFAVQGERLARLDDVAKYSVKSAKETSKREAEIKALVEIRNQYGQLLDSERAGKSGTEKLRKKLNKDYGNFVLNHGSINESFALKIFDKANDPLFPALAALENNTGTKKKPKYKPSLIFKESTQRAKKSIKKPSISDAFVLARNDAARTVDVEAVAKMANVTPEQVKSELFGKDALFETPAGTFEVKDIYLSGDVRKKLRDAEDAQKNGIDMTRNIASLKEVMPADVPYFSIETNLGATWIPPEVYQQFIGETANLPPELARTIKLKPSINGWIVKFDNARAIDSREETSTLWSTPGAPFSRIARAAFTGQAITIKARDEHGNDFTDTVASAAANEKVEAFREALQDWIWKDVDRRVSLEKHYNEVMNAWATPEYDGSFLSFDGMMLKMGEEEFNLRQHQVNAIWRGVANGRGLYAHEVGTGKTFTMGGIAVESRRYGLAKKPLILGHNANSASVASDIQEMYPGAKVLYIDNLTPKTIDQKLYQIANDDWDAVVLPHSLISRLTLSRETLDRLAAEEIEALEAEAIASAEEDGFDIANILNDEAALKKVRGASTAKELVKQRNKIIANIEKQAMAASKENAVLFEQLGIDMIIIDEAHEFKKPPISTRMKVKGLNTQTSDKAIALNFLTGYVKELNSGKGVHIFTGTPITNTLNEIYNHMRFTMSDEMEKADVLSWDAWFNTFASVESDVERTTKGDYESVSRLSGFHNVSELRRFAGQYMDIVFADDMPEFVPRETKSGKSLHDKDITEKEKDELLNGRVDTGKVVGRPYKKLLNEVAEMSPEQRDILAEIVERSNSFANASGKERREIMLSGDNRNPVIIETDAAKAGFDPRLYDKNLSDHPDNKINRCVTNVIGHYAEHKMTSQVIFMEKGYSDTAERSAGRNDSGEKIKYKVDVFNAAKELKNKLIEGGIPAEEIALVTGKVSKKKRKEIADKVNSAEIRVVIGLTATLGTGVNMQQNLRAMHHLDAPWMPGELEQRNGRGHRQGNRWNTVFEHRYITDNIDARRWQVLAKKQKMITDFLKAKDGLRSIQGDAVDLGTSDLDDINASFSEAAGDARILIREKLKKDIKKLERKQRTHDFGIVEAKDKIKDIGERTLPEYKERIAAFKSDMDHFASVVNDPYQITIDGKKFTKRDKAGVKLEQVSIAAAMKDNKGKYVKGDWDEKKVGEYRGFDIMAERNGSWSVSYYLKRETDHNIKPSIGSIDHNMRSMGNVYENGLVQIEEKERALERFKEVAKEPFGQETALKNKKEMLSQVEADLSANPDAPPSWLAQGAPIGTEIYYEGEKYEVEGHRKGDVGYYLMVKKGEQREVISYLDVMDENNLQVYEPIEGDQPVKKSGSIGRGAAGFTQQKFENADLPGSNKVKFSMAEDLKPLSRKEIIKGINDQEASLPYIMNGQPNWTDRPITEKMFRRLEDEGHIIYANKDDIWVSPAVLNKETGQIETPSFSTDQLPGAGVSFKEIQSRFKGQDVFMSKDGQVSIRLKNGHGLRVVSTNDMGKGDTQFAIQTGRMGKDGIILGKYKDNTITLNKDLASNFTRDHEVGHFLIDNGMLTQSDLFVLDGKIGALKRTGKNRFKISKDKEENRVNALAQLLEDREQYQDTAIGRILQKIADFIDGLLHIGRSSERKIGRQVESGQIFGREVSQKGSKLGKFQTTADKEYETAEDNFFQKATDMYTGFIKHRKDLGKNYEDDVSPMAHIFKTTMYSAEKIGGAYKRLWNAIRKQNDHKFKAQRDLWYEGDESILEDFKAYAKGNKAEYAELQEYLTARDIEKKGFLVKKEGDEYQLLHWKKKNGIRQVIGTFSDEEIAWKMGIRIEAQETGFSDKGKAALVDFRKMSHNLYHHFARNLEDSISAYEKAGQSLPQITIQNEEGVTQIDLRAAADKMGDLRGSYFPRLRNSGKWRVMGFKDGSAKQMQFFDTRRLPGGANTYRAELERKGYKTEIEKVGKFSEDLFASLEPLLAQQQILNKAMKDLSNEEKHRILEDANIKSRWVGNTFILHGSLRDDIETSVRHLGGQYKERWLGKTFRPEIVFEDVPAQDPILFEKKVTDAILHAGGLETDMDLAFAAAMVKQYDAVLKGRGARSRMLSRSENIGIDVTQGYELDPVTAITSAMQAAAGSQAKAIVAKEGSAAISGRDIQWKDFKEDKSEDIDGLEKNLDALSMNSPEEKARKKDLDNKLIRLRREMEANFNPSPNWIITKQRQIQAIHKEMKGLVKWTDATQAKRIKQDITQAKTGLYEEYLQVVEDRKLDAKTQATAHKEATAALKDILRNEEFSDRVLGTLKGLAVWQYLGLRVSSAAVNVTNMGFGVPAAINGETDNDVSIKTALKHIGASMKNFALHRRGKLTGTQQLVFDEIREKGWDSPVFNREAFDVLSSKLGKGWNFALEKSMWLFGKAEELNRAATISSTYFAMKEVNKGAWDHDAMMERAKDISDKAHGDYSKANRPFQMRGSNLASQVLQASYVFQTFTHNYLQEMHRLGWDKKQYKAALWMALSPAVFGIGAILPVGVAKGLSSALGGDDPEEELIKLAESSFGMGDIARNGIMGIFDHGINLRGSLATRFGAPSTFMDIFGAPGAVVSDWWEGGKNITNGDFMQGAEKMLPAAAGNILKGYREHTTGATTRSGSPIFWGKEQLRGDSIDMILRMLSFNPTNLSKKKEIQWGEYKTQLRYRAKKSELIKKFKAEMNLTIDNRSRHDILRIKADIRDYNKRIKDNDLTRLGLLITERGMKDAMRRNVKAPKRERLRKDL